MKKTKRFISLLLVIQMMLMCMLIPGTMAADVVTETSIESENAETVLAVTEISVEDLAQDELMPMAASECDDGSSWYNEDGSRNYPPNYGFEGGYSVTTLPAGTLLAYYGAGISGYFCMPGTPASTLALPPWNTGEYHLYHLPYATRFMYGTVASWGGSTGGGIQYVRID